MKFCKYRDYLVDVCNEECGKVEFATEEEQQRTFTLLKHILYRILGDALKIYKE